MKFYKCNTCGNFVELIKGSGVPMACCGSDMVELTANTEEASTEKHLPVVKRNGDRLTITVGSALHPMEEKHHIEFIWLETKNGCQRKTLEIGQQPTAEFCICNDEPIAAYEYCNLHGLWKTSL